MEKIIGSIVKSDKTVIRVTLSDYKGKDYLNIREWYTKDQSQWYPSNKGIAFTTEKVSEVVTLCEKAEEEIINGTSQGEVSE